MVTCPACGHAAPHLHIRDGGCQAMIRSRWRGRPPFPCGCTRNPRHVAAELDDPSEDVIARGEERDAQERREET